MCDVVSGDTHNLKLNPRLEILIKTINRAPTRPKRRQSPSRSRGRCMWVVEPKEHNVTLLFSALSGSATLHYLVFSHVEFSSHFLRLRFISSKAPMSYRSRCRGKATVAKSLFQAWSYFGCCQISLYITSKWECHKVQGLWHKKK